MFLSAGSIDRLGIVERALPGLVRFLIKSVTKTVRIRCEGVNVLDDLESARQCAVLAFFHGRQFLLTGFLRGRRLTVMSSLSRDGELQAQVMTGLGYKVVRGSASRGGARGLIGLKKYMDRGYHATFAVDGPKGPIHEVKPGAVYLAKKTGAPVVCMAASASPARILERAWDRYLLPWPFAKGAVVFGDPIYFDKDTGEEAMALGGRKLQEELFRLQERADEITGLKTRSQESGVGSQ